MGLVALSVFLPIMGTVRRKNLAGSVTDWALGAAGTLYLWRRCLLRDPDSLDGRHGLPQMADSISIRACPLPGTTLRAVSHGCSS